MGNLATAMRLLGQNPTESELKLIQESILRNRNGQLILIYELTVGKNI